MDKQEAFNKIWNGLQSQDWQRSFRDDETCAYRGFGGLKCAIGHLISDEDYSPEMESVSVSALKRMGLLPKNLQEIDINFLLNCQVQHDLARSAYCLRHGLRRIADQYGLIAPEENEEEDE